MQGLMTYNNYNQDSRTKESDKILKTTKVVLTLMHSRIFVRYKKTKRYTSKISIDKKKNRDIKQKERGKKKKLKTLRVRLINS